MKKTTTRQRSPVPFAQGQTSGPRYHSPGEPGDPHIWIIMCVFLMEFALKDLNHHLGVPVATGIGGFLVSYWKATRWLQVTTPIAALLSSLLALTLGLSLYVIMTL